MHRKVIAGRILATGLLLLAFACTGPELRLSHPEGELLACTAPPPPTGTRVFAGLESGLPATEGGLELVGATFDDRLSSPHHRALTWSDDGHLVTAERDRVIVWALDSGHAVRSVKLPEGVTFVDEVVVSPDESLAACWARHSADDGKTQTRQLLAVDLERGSVQLLATSESAATLGFSKDGDRLVAGGGVWDATTWEKLRSFWDGRPPVTRLPHPDRGTPRSDAARALDFDASKIFPTHGPIVREATLAFGARHLQYREPYYAADTAPGAARARPVPGRVTIADVDGTSSIGFDVPEYDSAVVLSSNGRYVGLLASTFTLREANSEAPIARVPDTRWATRADVSDDGRLLVLRNPRQVVLSEASDAEGAGPAVPPYTPRLQVWDLASGALLWERSGKSVPRFHRITPDGAYLWSPRERVVVDARTGGELDMGLLVRSMWKGGLALLDDAWGGTTLVRASSRESLLRPRRRAVIVAAASAGRRLATTGPDHALQLETPERCVLLTAPRNGVSTFFQGSVAFSGDGKTLIAGLTGSGPRLGAWDAETGKMAYGLDVQDGEVRLDPNTNTLVVTPTVVFPDRASAEILTLDVHTGETIDKRLPSSQWGTSIVDYFLPVIHGTRTVTGFSSDFTWGVQATEEGDLAVGRARSGKVIGRARFGARHDHVRFAWFPEKGRLAVQTARGAVFEFRLPQR